MIWRLVIVCLLVVFMASIWADISKENLLNSRRSWETCTIEGHRARIEGRLDQSIEWFEQSIQHSSKLGTRDPMRATSYLNLGTALLQKHNFERAETSLQTALGLLQVPTSNDSWAESNILEALHGITICEFRRGKAQQAEQSANEFLALYADCKKRGVQLNDELLGAERVDVLLVLRDILELHDDQDFKKLDKDLSPLISLGSVPRPVRRSIIAWQTDHNVSRVLSIDASTIEKGGSKSTHPELERLLMLGQFHMVIDNKRRARELFAQADGNDDSETQFLSKVFRQNLAFQRDMHPEKAEALLKDALQRTSGNDKFAVTIWLAEYYEKWGQPTKCESILSSLIDSSIKEGNRINTIIAMNEMGRFLMHKKDYQKARYWFLQTLALQRQREDNDKVLYASILDRLLMVTENLAERCALAEERVEIEKTGVRGASHLTKALLDLAYIHMKLHQNARALLCFDAAAELEKHTPYSFPYLVARTGAEEALLGLGQPQEVLKRGQVTLPLVREFFDPNTHNRANEVNRLAHCYIVTQQYQSAIDLLLQEKNLWGSTPPSPEQYNQLAKLAGALYRANRFEESAEYSRRYLAFLDEQFGTEGAAAARLQTSRTLAVALVRAKKLGEAVETTRTVMRQIEKDKVSPNLGMTAQITNAFRERVGELTNQGQFDQAEKLCKEILPFLEKHPTADSPHHIARFHRHLAIVYMRQRKLQNVLSEVELAQRFYSQEGLNDPAKTALPEYKVATEHLEKIKASALKRLAKEQNRDTRR